MVCLKRSVDRARRFACQRRSSRYSYNYSCVGGGGGLGGDGGGRGGLGGLAAEAAAELVRVGVDTQRVSNCCAASGAQLVTAEEQRSERGVDTQPVGNCCAASGAQLVVVKVQRRERGGTA